MNDIKHEKDLDELTHDEMNIFLDKFKDDLDNFKIKMLALAYQGKKEVSENAYKRGYANGRDEAVQTMLRLRSIWP